MSVLALLIDARPRADAAPPPAEYSWVASADGRLPSAQGRSPVASLPRADSVVAVLHDSDIAWHRASVPRAPAARLRDALCGALEEQVLGEVEDQHFALAPSLSAGQTGWVAATDRGWLSALVADLERAGVPLERVVPASTPAERDEPASGHFLPGPPGREDAPRLVLSDASGVACLSAEGSLARQRLAGLPAAVRWTAHPAVAASAERWLGGQGSVAVRTDAERALAAARGPWNLRQFDLQARHRGTLALREAWRRLRSPAWRPVRWGLAALALVQLAGLNAYAWRLERQLVERRQEMTRLLQTTHPQVRAVLDAPAQMQRETERLRVDAGRPGEADFESLLGAAAAIWPQGQAPVASLRFEGQRLSLAAAGWRPEQLAAARERLRPAGLAAELSEGRLHIMPLSQAPAPAPGASK
jgi:general secretion pathway protein L